MTSNIGVKKLQDFGTGVGFATQAKSYVEEEHKREILKKELQKFFAPEFLNRIDDVIVFNQLVKEDVKRIVQLEINNLQKRLSNLKYNINFDDTIVDMISEVGFDDLYGARPLKRAIQDKIEDFISEEVLATRIVENNVYSIAVVDNEIKLELITKVRKKRGSK